MAGSFSSRTTQADEDLLMVLDDLLVPDGATLCTAARHSSAFDVREATEKRARCPVVF